MDGKPGMNLTIFKFGYPETLIAEYEHWVVLVRQSQPTFGSLILAAKSDATAFGQIDPAAHTELAIVTQDIETALIGLVGYDRINYLMLMMVDPHVHFHVIPRHSESRHFADLNFVDHGWPKAPDLGTAIVLEPDTIETLRTAIKQSWLNHKG
jgi:diadenosine tetraphosphate (Ap4A) HIT family hydrolase